MVRKGNRVWSTTGLSGEAAKKTGYIFKLYHQRKSFGHEMDSLPEIQKYIVILKRINQVAKKQSKKAGAVLFGFAGRNEKERGGRFYGRIQRKEENKEGKTVLNGRMFAMAATGEK